MLNKKTALKILSEIKAAKKILLVVHVSPDPDGICSALAMDLLLRKWSKKTKIISFSQIPAKWAFFPGFQTIENKDFVSVNFSEYDLAIILDAADESKVTRSNFPEKFPKNFKIINIDHHATSSNFGNINLVQNTASSTAEVLYELFEVWKIKLGKDLAKMLFFGIFSDTGCFQFQMTSKRTFAIATDLLNKGADLQECVLYEFRSYNFKTLKYWGKVLDNMQIDESKKFVWSTMSQKEKEELKLDPTEIEGASTLFAPIVSGTEFGIILNEESGNIVRGSLRSRKDFDVSKIAVFFGGGGHKTSAGFWINATLEEAEKKVLEVARKFLVSE